MSTTPLGSILKLGSFSSKLPPKFFEGRVIACIHDKTVTVAVSRFKKHPKYKKTVHLTKKYMVHDEENTCDPGDRIIFEKSKTFSKRKHWKLTRIVKKDPSAEFLKLNPEYLSTKKPSDLHMKSLRIKEAGKAKQPTETVDMELD